MGVWDALIAGVIGAGSAYVSSKSAKKQSEHAHDEWERRMQYEEEKIARKQNSMGGRLAPYLMEQMLRVYGDQSKGRGGFTLPIDEIMQNMQLKQRQSGDYNGGDSRSSGSFSMGNKKMSGSINRDLDSMLTAQLYGSDGKRYLKGIDAELEGDVFNTQGKSASLEGAASGGGGYWGTSAGAVGGPREATRGMGSTTTQTERGYGQLTPISDGNGFSISQRTPIQQGDLATGGERNVATYGKEINLPEGVMKKLGLAAMRQGVTKLVPGLGLITMVGGKLYQRYGKSDGKQSFLETILGIKDKNHGRWFGNNPDQVDPQVAYAPYIDPVSPLG